MVTEYARFAETMAYYGYAWEPHKVITEDDYILTTFHILGKTGVPYVKPDQGSVLIQHGAYMDGASFVGANPETTPFHL